MLHNYNNKWKSHFRRFTGTFKTAAVMMTGLVWILHLSDAECLCLFYFQRRCSLNGQNGSD